MRQYVCFYLTASCLGFVGYRGGFLFVTFRGLFIMLAECEGAGVMWAWGGLWQLQPLAVLSAMCAGILSTV